MDQCESRNDKFPISDRDLRVKNITDRNIIVEI